MLVLSVPVLFAQFTLPPERVQVVVPPANWMVAPVPTDKFAAPLWVPPPLKFRVPLVAPAVPVLLKVQATELMPVPPVFWRRKEPIGAVILIGFGLLLLLNQMGLLAEHLFKFLWPLIFIALGVWLIFRRLEDTKGGQQ